MARKSPEYRQNIESGDWVIYKGKTARVLSITGGRKSGFVTVIIDENTNKIKDWPQNKVVLVDK